jgi:hypothetical protein
VLLPSFTIVSLLCWSTCTKNSWCVVTCGWRVADQFTTNPTPLALANGSVLLLYKARSREDYGA